jgi:hypothetical protein
MIELVMEYTISHFLSPSIHASNHSLLPKITSLTPFHKSASTPFSFFPSTYVPAIPNPSSTKAASNDRASYIVCASKEGWGTRDGTVRLNFLETSGRSRRVNSRYIEDVSDKGKAERMQPHPSVQAPIGC